MDENNNTPPTGEQAPTQQTDSMQKLLDMSNATNLDDAVKWAENANKRLGSSINLPPDATTENNAEIQRKLAARGYDVMLKPDLSDPDQMKAINAMLGVPEEVDGYKLPEMDENFKYNEEGAKKFIEGAHKYGLTQSQMEGILRDNAALAMSQEADFKQHQFDGIAALKAELGYAYDEKYKQAEAVMKIINPEMDMSGVSADQIRGALNLAEHYNAMGQEGQNFGRQEEATRRTPEEAKAKIQEVTAKLLEMKPNDVGYKELIEQKRALYKEAYAGKGSPDGTARIGGVQFS